MMKLSIGTLLYSAAGTILVAVSLAHPPGGGVSAGTIPPCGTIPPTPTPVASSTEEAKANLTVHVFMDVNGDGHPFHDIFLPGYELVVTDTAGEEYLLVTDWRGSASIIGLHPGHWYIYTGNVEPLMVIVQPGANLHVQVPIHVVAHQQLLPILGE